MRVAVVVGAFPVVSETFILSQLQAILDAGHDLVVIAAERNDAEVQHQLVTDYGLLDKLVVRPALPPDRVGRLIGGLTLAARHARARPRLTLGALNALRFGRHAASMALLQTSLALAEGAPLDIVHCHFGWNGTLAVQARQLGAFRAPIITTFHGLDANVYARRPSRRHAFAPVFAHGEFVTVGSQFMRHRLLELGAPEHKLRVLPTGVDLAQFKPPSHRRQQAPQVEMVSVGRLVEVKGHASAIAAVGRLRNDLGTTLPPFRLTLVGDGPLRPELEALARGLGVAENVRFLGAVPYERLPAVLAQAHILVHPSVRGRDGAEEGQGRAVLEAQAAGLAVVATRTGGLPECVDVGASAILVPPEDPEALADALATILRQPDRGAAMGRCGRAFVEQRYAMTDLNQQLLALYEEARTQAQ